MCWVLLLPFLSMFNVSIRRRNHQAPTAICPASRRLSIAAVSCHELACLLPTADFRKPRVCACVSSLRTAVPRRVEEGRIDLPLLQWMSAFTEVVRWDIDPFLCTMHNVSTCLLYVEYARVHDSVSRKTRQ